MTYLFSKAIITSSSLMSLRIACGTKTVKNWKNKEKKPPEYVTKTAEQKRSYTSQVEQIRAVW